MCILICRFTVFTFTFMSKQFQTLTEQSKSNFIVKSKLASEQNKLTFKQYELPSTLTSHHHFIHSFIITYQFNYENDTNCLIWTTKYQNPIISTKIFFGYYDR